MVPNWGEFSDQATTLHYCVMDEVTDFTEKSSSDLINFNTRNWCRIF